MKYLLILLLISIFNVFVHIDVFAQNSVSIGTNEINENAVLRLVSPGNNQGLLLPRLTTIQRESMSLGANDNGMLVYDNDLHLFYYWHNGQWYPLLTNNQQLTITGSGSTLISGTYPNFTIFSNPNDTSSDNEIQDLQLTANNLVVTKNASATPIDLSRYLDNTDNQQLEFRNDTILISNGNSVNIKGVDNQTLELSGNNLSIIDGNSVNLAPYLDNTDNQSLNLSGNILAISGSNSVDLSAVDNQTLILTNNNLSISEGNSVNLAGYLDNTDNQQLNLTGNTLSISGGNSVALNFPDDDNQNLNEVLTQGNNAGNLTITGLATPVNNSDAATKQYVDSWMPRGAIIMWSGTTIPSGWALCDGTNGTPNLTGRFIVGYSPSVPDYNNPGNFSTGGSNAGNTGGEQSHILNMNEMPYHSHGGGAHNHGGATQGEGGHGHTVNGGAHNHYLDDSNQLDGGGLWAVIENTDDIANTSYDGMTLDGGTHTHTVSPEPDHTHIINPSGTIINPEGSGVAHENRPPYYTLAFIMKL